jgi:serine protease
MRSIAKSAQVLCWLLVALATISCTTASRAAQSGTAVGLIVKLRNAPAHVSTRESPRARGRGNLETDGTRWQRVLKGSQVAPRRMRPVGRASQLLDFGRPLPAAEAREIAEMLSRQPDVEWVVPNEREHRLQVVPNEVVPNDPYYPATAPGTGQWWLRRVSGSDGNVLADRLRGVPGFQAAWSTGIAGRLGDPSAIVAVLDTGITSGAYAHPELEGKVIAGYDFVSEVEYANDGDGRDADPSDPGDWVDHGDLANPAFDGCMLEASSWHGTLIAGQIAALTNNGQGVAGIGWNTKVLAVRVAGKCGATVSDIVDGIRWAAGLPVVGVPIINPNPARIINISFGGDAACNAEYQAAIDEVWNSKGAIVVAAAGNEHAGLSRPASCDKVVGVVGLNRDGFKNNYSNFGAKAVIATVGGDDDGTDSGLWSQYLADDGILTVDNCGSTVPRMPSTCPNGPYAFLYGTSFSAPLVSGAAALMLSANPALTAQQLVDGLKASARPHVTSPLIGTCSWNNPGRCICTTSTCGAGILDAERALLYAEAVKNGQYQAPNWQTVILDNPEIRAAVALSPTDRDPNPPVTDGSTKSNGGGGGAMGIGWLILLALATVELARLRLRPTARVRRS